MSNKSNILDYRIITSQGHHVDLSIGPTPEQVNIEDIAHHLAYQCRFVGACKRFYSIAEHSIYVALLAGPNMFRPYFLLHDSPEYCLHDLTRPLKLLFRSHTDIYDKLTIKYEKTIFPALGLSYEKYKQLEKDIKDVDLFVYSLERKSLFGEFQSMGLPSDHPLYKAPFGMPPEEAEALFIKTFNELMN